MMRRVVRWTVVILIVAGLGYLGWRQTRPKPIDVIVKPVVRGTVEKTVANTRAGTVKACRRARLTPSIGGQISKLPVKEGDKVTAGQLLLEVWNEDLSAQLELAQREATAAEATAKATCLNAEVAQRNADRAQKLLPSRTVSEENADRAVTQAKALRAQCESARASVAMSNARIDVAKATLNRTRLYAPFDGVVAEITGELNEYVTPSPVGVPTLPTVDLIENNCFYVTAPIDEVDAAGVQVGMPTRITLDAFKDKRFEGHVRRIAPYVLDLEKQARTVDVEASFLTPEDISHLLAGYSADVEIILAVKKDTLRIPTEAILDGKKVFVFVPAEKIIREVAVKTGLSNWAFTEILSGLREGQSVVVNVDRQGIKDGVAAALSQEATP
ncbi:MAG: efflux RND transporter periplasmic adaptor subunit [Desulfobacterales bacterium]|jgi:HlyD family secretion protein|nr:efflux RND transporter periplasmic adaptor subunit [Desulfobacterales bacterium]